MEDEESEAINHFGKVFGFTALKQEILSQILLVSLIWSKLLLIEVFLCISRVLAKHSTFSCPFYNTNALQSTDGVFRIAT